MVCRDHAQVVLYYVCTVAQYGIVLLCSMGWFCNVLSLTTAMILLEDAFGEFREKKPPDHAGI